MEEEQPHHLSPGVIGLIALLSIGGLLFVGWEAKVTGDGMTGAVSYISSACCTFKTWEYSPQGERKSTSVTTTETCYPGETPTQCCAHAGKYIPKYPAEILSASPGVCVPPELSYPLGKYDQYSACCTTQTWRYAPSGFTQGIAQTTTERCHTSESSDNCCLRAVSSKSTYKIRLLGSRGGQCDFPEVSYPALVPVGGYSVCCTTQTWQLAPTGYSQGTAQTTTEACDQLERPQQCCMRSAGARSSYPIRFIGVRTGGCRTTIPEQSYPIWLR